MIYSVVQGVTDFINGNPYGGSMIILQGLRTLPDLVTDCEKAPPQLKAYFTQLSDQYKRVSQSGEGADHILSHIGKVTENLNKAEQFYREGDYYEAGYFIGLNIEIYLYG